MAEHNPLAVRGQRRQARIDALKHEVAVVSVEVTKPEYARVLKHPHSGGFKKSGETLWLNDSFTQRRLNDGSIRIVERPADEKPEKPEKPARASH